MNHNKNIGHIGDMLPIFIILNIQTIIPGTMTKSYLNQLTNDIIGAAVEVHHQLGPLLESIYHECMKIELTNRNIPFKTEMVVPVVYHQQRLKDTR